jgi:hypothetical protein
LSADEIRLALPQRRLRLGELRARRGDFRGPARLLEVREGRLRLPDACFGFRARRPLLLAFEREQRRVLLDLRPPLDRKLLQRARQRRGDPHVFAFHVAGIAGWRPVAAAGEREHARERRQTRGHPRCSMDES